MRELTYLNKRFLIPEGVYVPSDDSYLLVDSLEVNEGDVVLDMGCGSGILGVFAAERASRILSVDISPQAIACARKNFELNLITCANEFQLSDLFSEVPEKFDLILFNPPYLPIPADEKREDPIEQAWDGGVTGRQIIDRFFESVSYHLKVNGRILFLQSSLARPEQTFEMVECLKFRWTILEKRKFFFEELIAILIQG